MVTNNRIVSIVEDDPSNILFFHEALKEIWGVTIFTFRDPILALERFQENDYAYVLVISDFKPSGLNGMELLKNIKDLNPIVRTILITVHFRLDNKQIRKYIKNKIINGFVQKPIGLHDLLKEVDTQFRIQIWQCLMTSQN